MCKGKDEVRCVFCFQKGEEFYYVFCYWTGNLSYLLEVYVSLLSISGQFLLIFEVYVGIT